MISIYDIIERNNVIFSMFSFLNEQLDEILYARRSREARPTATKSAAPSAPPRGD